MKPKVLTSPKYKVNRGEDPTRKVFKLFLFGPTGSGKTYVIKDLLLAGLKVLVLSTDAGGSGLNTVLLALEPDQRHLFYNNLIEIVLNNDDAVQQFIKAPDSMIPDIYDFDPDVVFWDGFGNWQQVHLSEAIGAMPVERDGGKEISAGVESGLMFEQAQWGMLRNGTVRTIDKFVRMGNKKTGKIWHKIATAHETVRMKQKKAEGVTEKGVFDEVKMPLLQGAGGILVTAAFDLVVRTKHIKDADPTKDRYVFQIQAENLVSKNRGFKLPDMMPANMGLLWEQVVKDLAIQKGEIDENLKEEVDN